MTSLAFSEDGSQLAAGTATGTSVFATDLAVWRETACRIVGRELTAEERRAYLGDPSAGSGCEGRPTEVAAAGGER